MPRCWLRPAALLTLALFPIASTPGLARSLLWGGVGSGCGEQGCSSPCCRGFGLPTVLPGHNALSKPVHADCHEEDGDEGRDCPGRPFGPFDPGCPNPSCWCHAAHALYAPNLAAIAIGPAAALPDKIVEAAPSLPPSPCADLMRPPRA
jgi:hypothetical protein